MESHENDKRAFTRRLREAFKDSRLTQEELAEATGAGVGTVNGWIKDGAMPGAERLIRLPEALGVSGHWLLTGEEPKHPAPPERATLALGWIDAFVKWARATEESEEEDAQAALEAAEGFLAWFQQQNGGAKGTG